MLKNKPTSFTNSYLVSVELCNVSLNKQKQQIMQNFMTLIAK